MFTKLGRAISVAVRQGRGVEDAVAKARSFNMPKENIHRAIDRGSGAGNELHEVTFEGFAPGGVAVMVMAVTDNKLRTAQAVWSLLNKGAVAYVFSADMKPNFWVEVVDADMRQKIETLLEKLEDLDDVQKVYSNYA